MKKANLNARIYGVKGGNPQYINNKGMIVTNIDNSVHAHILIDAFQGEGETYKRREECLIEIQNFYNKSVFSGTFNDLLALIEKANQLTEDPDTITITWSVEDFESKAVENEEWEQTDDQEERPVLYDRSKFREALHEMRREHDCEMGITWDTVDNYLEEFCKIESIPNE